MGFNLFNPCSPCCQDCWISGEIRSPCNAPLPSYLGISPENSPISGYLFLGTDIYNPISEVYNFNIDKIIAGIPDGHKFHIPNSTASGFPVSICSVGMVFQALGGAPLGLDANGNGIPAVFYGESNFADNTYLYGGEINYVNVNTDTDGSQTVASCCSGTASIGTTLKDYSGGDGGCFWKKDIVANPMTFTFTDPRDFDVLNNSEGQYYCTPTEGGPPYGGSFGPPPEWHKCPNSPLYPGCDYQLPLGQQVIVIANNFASQTFVVDHLLPGGLGIYGYCSQAQLIYAVIAYIPKGTAICDSVDRGSYPESVASVQYLYGGALAMYADCIKTIAGCYYEFGFVGEPQLPAGGFTGPTALQDAIAFCNSLPASSPSNTINGINPNPAFTFGDFLPGLLGIESFDCPGEVVFNPIGYPENLPGDNGCGCISLEGTYPAGAITLSVSQ